MEAAVRWSRSVAARAVAVSATAGIAAVVLASPASAATPPPISAGNYVTIFNNTSQRIVVVISKATTAYGQRFAQHVASRGTAARIPADANPAR